MGDALQVLMIQRKWKLRVLNRKLLKLKADKERGLIEKVDYTEQRRYLTHQKMALSIKGGAGNLQGSKAHQAR